MDEDQELWNESLDAGTGSEAATGNEGLPDGWTQEEYDAYLQEAEAEEAGQTAGSPVAQTPVEAGEPAAPAISLPLIEAGAEQLFQSAEEEDAYNDWQATNPAAAANWLFNRQQEVMLRNTQRMMQAQMVTAPMLSRAESEFPEVFATHGGTIRQLVGGVGADVAGNPETLFGALIAPFILEVKAGADPLATAKRMGRMLTRQGQGTPAPVGASPAPSARVAPSSSRGGGDAPAFRGRTPNVVKDMMELFGAEEGEVRRALDSAKGR